MKARNMFLALALTLVAAIGFLFNATSADAMASAVPGAATESFSRNFGMFGLTAGQTARLNLVNLETGEFVPCVRVELSFIDANGNTLLQKVYDIDRGKSAYLDLSGNQFASRGRAQLRAQVRFVDNPDLRDDPFFRNCLPTLELVDNATGRTTTFLNPPEPNLTRLAAATN